MYEIDKKFLDVGILSILTHSARTPLQIRNELNQQGSNLVLQAVERELENLLKKNLVTQTFNPSKFIISAQGRQSLGNLFSFLFNHINTGAWERLKTIRKGVIQTSNLNQGDVVLDCSSGIGDQFTLELSKIVGSKGQVIFLTQDARFDLSYFEKLINQKPEFSNISFVIKSEFIGKIESNSIDAIFQIFGLHLYENIGVIMHEMGRILKPGRKIILCDPLEIDHFLFNEYRKTFSSMHTGTTPHTMEAVLTQAGFHNIRIDTVDGLCVASAEKPSTKPMDMPLQPLIKKDEVNKEKEKHYYKL